MNNNRKAGKMLLYCGDFFDVTLKKTQVKIVTKLVNDGCSFDILRFPCFVRLFQILEQCVLESTIAIDFWLTLHRK